MALTVSKRMFDLYGPSDRGGVRLKQMHLDISFDASYPTGGEALDLSGDFTTLLGVWIESKSGYVFEYDYTNKTVLVYYADYDAGADGALIQFPNATSLAAVVNVKALAWGI